MNEGWQPTGVTPSLRSGAAAKSARLQWCRNGGDELPKSEVRGGGRVRRDDSLEKTLLLGKVEGRKIKV